MSEEPVVGGREDYSFLAENEDAELNWAGTLKEGEDEYLAEFVATSNRLIFSLGGGHFKDIGFQHVESVEVATDVEKEYEGMDPNALQGLGIFLAVIGAGVLYMVGSGDIAPPPHRIRPDWGWCLFDLVCQGELG